MTKQGEEPTELMSSSTSSMAVQSSSQPACYALPAYGPPASSTHDQHQLHGADDLITLFRLKPLWERSVKPYPTAPRSIAKRKRTSTANGGGATAGVLTTADGQQEGSAPTVDEQPRVMEKTYVDYVRDLPGKVCPPKRSVSKYTTALTAAGAARMAPPPVPAELTGRTTMRDIVFRPETTMQRIGPFDEDALRAAFTVAAGPLADIDLSLLESDDVERTSPSKKKKKRKLQRDPNERGADDPAAKRSRLSAIVSGRSVQARPP